MKIAAIVVVAYVGLVGLFESGMGYFQPTNASTLVITSFDADGTAHDRVVSRLESNGQIYVAANHWPRAWYKRVLANPDVQVVLESEKEDRRAVPVDGEEHDQVNSDNGLPFLFRVVTGFPPRYFVRLDPRS